MEPTKLMYLGRRMQRLVLLQQCPARPAVQERKKENGETSAFKAASNQRATAILSTYIPLDQTETAGIAVPDYSILNSTLRALCSDGRT
jgi:hypothetical protein